MGRPRLLHCHHHHTYSIIPYTWIALEHELKSASSSNLKQWVEVAQNRQAIEHDRVSWFVPSNIVLRRLYALESGAKDRIPEQSLLAIVVALAVSDSVMEIVILRDQFAVEVMEEPCRRGRRRNVETHTAVSEELGEDDVLVANPPVEEAHGKSHQLQGEIGDERYDGNVEDFLFGVGEQSQERCGVLGQVMGAVVLPQAVKLVH